MRSLISLKACAAATVTAVALCFGTPVGAEMPNDQQALACMSEVKVAFDLTNGDPKQLLTQFTIIDKTRQGVMSQGAKPDFILAFRGPATKLEQTDRSQVKAEDHELTSKITEKVRQLRGSSGLTSVEQCGVAVRLAGTKPENVLPEIKVVGNSWISLMAYRAKGYGYIAS